LEYVSSQITSPVHLLVYVGCYFSAVYNLQYSVTRKRTIHIHKHQQRAEIVLQAMSRGKNSIS